MAEEPEIQALRKQLQEYRDKEKAILDRVQWHGRTFGRLEEQFKRLMFAAQAATGGSNYMGITQQEKATWKQQVAPLKQAIAHQKQKLDGEFPNVGRK